MKILLNRICLFVCISFLSGICANAQTLKPIKGWKYTPEKEESWNLFTDSAKKGDWEKIAQAVESYRPYKDVAAIAERELLIAKYCEIEKLIGCSYVVAKNIVAKYPGAEAALEAWTILERLALDEVSDDDELIRLVNKGNFVEIPESMEGMFRYLVALGNMQKSLNEWVEPFVKAIPDESAWRIKWDLIAALSLVGKKKTNEIIKTLALLEERAKPFPRLKTRIALQRARLLFEEKRMSEAESIYSTFGFAGRETGRALLERAWIRYYDRDFSTALGMLESLKAPYFSVSQNPEQYVLGMLAYKDLCHFSAVGSVAKSFEERYFDSIEAIKKNSPLWRNKDLMWMALQRSQYAPMADLIYHFKNDQDRIQTDKVLQGDTKKVILGKLKQAESELRERLEHQLAPELERQAEKLLDTQEQVKLIDYVASLEAYNSKKISERGSYQSEKVEKIAIEKLYWPVETEYWWSEMPQYRVLISDQCKVRGVR